MTTKRMDFVPRTPLTTHHPQRWATQGLAGILRSDDADRPQSAKTRAIHGTASIQDGRKQMTLTTDQRMIRDEAARFLSERASRDHLRSLIDSGTRSDAALWRTIAQELGWCALAIPEDSGGLGLGMVELSIVMELTGGALAPVPLWSTVCLAAPLLGALGDETILPRIAAGEVAATVALPDPGAVDGGAPQVVAESGPDGYRLTGTIPCVIDAEVADLILIPARIDGQIGLFLLPADRGQVVEPLGVMDATRPMARLVLESVSLPPEARLDRGGLPPDALALALDQARLGLAAEQIGAAAAVMDLTLAYIAERVQFGRTIASFQAIKHRCALLQVQLAEARSLAWGAATGFASLPARERGMEIAALKVLADDLAQHAAREAIQMHGGVAMTWEYDPHFYFKRAQATSALLGHADQHLDRIADGLLGKEA